mgnify:CR=1 FL=1
MNPFNLLLKGMSQVLVAYANGLSIIANGIDFFLKDPSKRDHPPLKEAQAEESPAKSEPSTEPEKEPEKPAGDNTEAKSSHSTFFDAIKKPSQKGGGRSSISKPKSKSKIALQEKPRPRAASKSGAQTDTGKVFQFISQSSRGADVDTIAKETGFNRQKIYGIVSRLKKQDKIKNPETGFYKKA